LKRPYLFFGDYLWSKYSSRVLKLPINAGLTCPNRDGTLGYGGCIFCSQDGSASPASSACNDIAGQMEEAKKNFRRSDGDTRYIAYFQAYTNTHSPAEALKKMYDQALRDKDVIGLMIGTRPDCLPDEVLDLIGSYKKDDFELWIEIGMQTKHDRSLRFLNRMHGNGATRDAVIRASARGIPVCLHMILGIPGESWHDMMESAVEVSSLPAHGVKIHHLHVIRDTPLEAMYRQGKVPMMSMKEYASTACDFIERLRPDIMIHRLMGDRNESSLIAPLWGMHKGTVIKAIDDEFTGRGSSQGILYNGYWGDS